MGKDRERQGRPQWLDARENNSRIKVSLKQSQCLQEALSLFQKAEGDAASRSKSTLDITLPFIPCLYSYINCKLPIAFTGSLQVFCKAFKTEVKRVRTNHTQFLPACIPPAQSKLSQFGTAPNQCCSGEMVNGLKYLSLLCSCMNTRLNNLSPCPEEGSSNLLGEKYNK